MVINTKFFSLGQNFFRGYLNFFFSGLGLEIFCILISITEKLGLELGTTSSSAFFGRSQPPLGFLRFVPKPSHSKIRLRSLRSLRQIFLVWTSPSPTPPTYNLSSRSPLTQSQSDSGLPSPDQPKATKFFESKTLTNS